MSTDLATFVGNGSPERAKRRDWCDAFAKALHSATGTGWSWTFYRDSAGELRDHRAAFRPWAAFHDAFRPHWPDAVRIDGHALGELAAGFDGRTGGVVLSFGYLAPKVDTIGAKLTSAPSIAARRVAAAIPAALTAWAEALRDAEADAAAAAKVEKLAAALCEPLPGARRYNPRGRSDAEQNHVTYYGSDVDRGDGGAVTLDAEVTGHRGYPPSVRLKLDVDADTALAIAKLIGARAKGGVT